MLGTSASAAFCVLILLYYFCFTRKFKYWKNKNVAFLNPTPFFGNFLRVFTFQESIGDALEKMYRKTQEPYLGFYMWNQPCLLIRDPQLIKMILVKDFKTFDNRNLAQNFEDDPVGSSTMIALKTPNWFTARKQLANIFSLGKLKAMYSQFLEPLDTCMQFLINHDSKIVDIKDVATKLTTDFISSAAFGINADCFNNRNSEFLQTSNRLFNFNNFKISFSTSAYFLAHQLVYLFGLKFVDTETKEFLLRLLQQIIPERLQQDTFRDDFVDVLIGQLDPITKQVNHKMLGQATSIFSAGVDTISATITFALFELARCSNIQDTIRAEIFENCNNSNISFADLEHMKYVEMCVKETLRMYPVLPFLDRNNNTTYKLLNSDLKLDKNTPVFISTLGLHYDSQYWSDPYKFNPDRFSTENEPTRVPFTYLPFGSGPRMCMGMRYGIVTVKIALVRILSQFKVELVDTSQEFVSVSKAGFFLFPNKPVFLRFVNLEEN